MYRSGYVPVKVHVRELQKSDRYVSACLGPRVEDATQETELGSKSTYHWLHIGSVKAASSHAGAAAKSSKHVTESDFVHRPTLPALNVSSSASTSMCPSKNPCRCLPLATALSSC